jgi:hypothetical protein
MFNNIGVTEMMIAGNPIHIFIQGPQKTLGLPLQERSPQSRPLVCTCTARLLAKTLELLPIAAPTWQVL